MDYFKNKSQMALNAVGHTNAMERMYKSKIYDSVVNTGILDRSIDDDAMCRIRDIFVNNHTVDSLPTIEVVDCTTVDYIMQSRNKCLVLNFASYKNPGGMFLEGSSAQEESLCHASTLYNVLRKFQDFYNFNKRNLNNGMYLDRALVSPDIRFNNISDYDCEHTKYADVITCAAPNNTHILMNKDRDSFFTDMQAATIALFKRIEFVMKAAIFHTYDPNYKKATNGTLLLGAYGCGVFKQNPCTVADDFRHFIDLGYADYFDKVVFAIPGGENYEVFYNTFRNYFKREE